MIEAASGSTIEEVNLVGDRSKTQELAPSDRTFASFYRANGILIQGAKNVTVRNVKAREIGGYAVLVSASEQVLIDQVIVSDSGSLNAKGRNNTTGGILLEEGTKRFQVRNCRLKAIRGNGIWTHSRYTSPRNADGLMEGNEFDEIGRDALQVGHATRVRVQRNSGHHIGYPVEVIDYEGGGIPVAVDTAGNVDQTFYVQNRFDDIQGKCMDLDGFHHGALESNVCTNVGHYGIVFNNTNPDMKSRSIRVTGNTIDGAKYGGIFVIGSGHTITGNQLRRLNQNRCPNAADCIFDVNQPDMLSSGIYLGDRAERPESTVQNTITGNTISGINMKQHCIGKAAAVKLSDQSIQNNTCTDQ